MVRKIVAHSVTFLFYCIVLPATVLTPEVAVPKWASIYIPSIITALNALSTPRLISYHSQLKAEWKIHFAFYRQQLLHIVVDISHDLQITSSNGFLDSI